MRVPSIGLPLEERRIVREGYRLAERMLRDYRDPPGLFSWGALKSLIRGAASRSTLPRA